MKPGDQVKVTVLGRTEAFPTGCAIVSLEVGTSFVMTVSGESLPHPQTGCKSPTAEAIPPDPYASTVDQCETGRGYLNLQCSAQISDTCGGRVSMELGRSALSEDQHVTDDGILNVSWYGDTCYEVGCTDQYVARLEWIPK